MALIAPYRVRHEAETNNSGIIYAVGPREAGDVWMKRIAGLDADERASAWAENRVTVQRLSAWQAVLNDMAWIFHASSREVAAAAAADRTGGDPKTALLKAPDILMLQQMDTEEVLAQMGHVWGVGRAATRRLRQWMPTWEPTWQLGTRKPSGSTVDAMRFLIFMAQEWPFFAPDTPPSLYAYKVERAIGERSARKAMEIHGGSVDRQLIGACLDAGLKPTNRILTGDQTAALRALEAVYGWRDLTESELLVLWEQGHYALEDHRAARCIPRGFGTIR